MSTEALAVLLAAGITAAVGLIGALGLARLARERPSIASFGAPIVLIAALATGVAVAARSMLIGDAEYRTLVFVLLAAAPMALLVGLVLARRIRAMEREAAQDRADRERRDQVEHSRRETVRWLSHDLLTPLAGIRALAESLVVGGVPDPDAAHLRIVTEVDRMDAMVGDIAELSRLHAVHSPSRREVSALDDLVSDAVATIGPLAAAAQVEVVATSLCGALVDVDPGALLLSGTTKPRSGAGAAIGRGCVCGT